MMKKFSCCIFFLVSSQLIYSQNIISEIYESGAIPFIKKSSAVAIYVERADDPLVHKAASMLQHDIEMVTDIKPQIIYNLEAPGKNVVIIGTVSKCSVVDRLAKEKRINIATLKNKWECFRLQSINKPFKGVENALVIVGSDKRGTAYGVFELSEQLGVSPWYWWADVPVKKKKEVYIKKGAYQFGPPSVKYRGIFINDEAPALSGWSKEKFGGFNHLFYEKVFELVLRLKANYLWPAMWGNAFYDDDSLNKKTAEDYGIVIGTSHHEPLMRAHDEWRRYGKGAWNYDSNEVRLKEFWTSGLKRASNEKIVTVGMRGDGDMPMTRGTATALLERIVSDQRKIIQEVTGKPPSETPQLWALYKEVQDYYDKGMRVPDDVTLLLCDDNWGNIRKLPKLTDQKRKGGYGIYYHFDYVGGPRNYKWINTNNIARVWEQMHLAYEYGVDKIWIVNVGDIKPMELPISFFLDYAWDVKKWNEDNLRDYYRQWATKQFGDDQAKEIAEILRKYSQYASRRKPELLDANTYDLTQYFEADKIVNEWKELHQEAEKINQGLPAEYRDAFFELALHPIKAFSNLHELYYAVAQNKRFGLLKYSAANEWAEEAKQFYINDSLISLQYHTIANGKWNHMMDQTHIGYTYWQQPPANKMPVVQIVSKQEVQPAADFGLKDVANALVPDSAKGNVFYEEERLVSINAQHWTKAFNSKNIKWKTIPDIGKDGDGITTFPVTASSALNSSAPHVEYNFYCYSKDSLKLLTYFSSTLNFNASPNGLEFAVSIDDELPQIASLNKDDNTGVWNSWVANNIIIKTTKHFISQPGKHVVKYWMIDPGIVLQKLVVDFGGVKPSYLGPPETILKQNKN